MKPKLMKPTTQNNGRLIPNRRGSTLLVVIALLAMLSLLGVVFYTFASQEERSAQYFTEASLNEADPGLDADVLFNWGLKQLIVGPDDQFYNSALHGKRHSLLTNMFGSDVHPFSGQGINVGMNSSGVVSVDQDYDGTADNPDFLALNLSRAAHGGTLPTPLDQFPQPDVDYTAPDINNLFLAYNGYALDGATWRRVIIPSFVRPQFFRDRSTGGTAGDHIQDWYENDGSLNSTQDTRTFVLRPHPAHVFVAPDGTASATPRFTNSFPFQPTTHTGGNATLHGEMGIFTSSYDATGYPIMELDVNNDGDKNDIREGIWMDLDFPPIEDSTDPTKYVLPLFSFTVYDLDALVNLNTAGNMRRPNNIDLNYTPSNNFFGEHSSIYTDKYLFLSRSNMGLSSPGEVNPQWVLNARPGIDLHSSTTAAAEFEQHRMFFGGYPYPYGGFAAPRSYASYTTYSDFQTAYESTRDWRELSNMEYFFLNFGRPDFKSPGSPVNGTQNDVKDLFPGRWGEPSFLYNALRVSTGDNMFVLDKTTTPATSFPRAGRTLIDDNANRYEGGPYSGSIAGGRSNTHPFLHPLAYNGSGRTTKTGVNYRQPTIGYNGWRGYEDIELAGLIRYNGSSAFFKNPIRDETAESGVLVDEADEITVDLEKVRRPYDEPFTPGDLAFLHMAEADMEDIGVTSRLEKLAPFNFGRALTTNIRGNRIRKKFTTMSWGRKQFSKSIINGLRNWETNNSFPPFNLAANIDPFRPALRELFYLERGNTRNSSIQMKLNLNQVLVYESTGTGRQIATRPLTVHPGEDYNGNGSLDTGEDLNDNSVLDSLPAGAIPTSWDGSGTLSNSGQVTYPNLPTYPPTTPQQQEFWARYDRQLMARDIYVLLYTLGGGSESINYSTASSPYTTAQLKEMAQFAVNVVDSLDPDDVITRFEYDTNLSNGWGLDDNPYTNDGGDRAIIYGAEAQKLTLSEFLAIKANKVEDSTSNPYNHDATEYDDEKDRYFSFIELRNASPQTVSFNNDAWQIRLEPRSVFSSLGTREYTNLDTIDADDPEPVFNNTHKRRLTLRSGSVLGGGIFNILSAGDNENIDPMSSMPRPSYFRVDPNFSGGTPIFSTVAPVNTSVPSVDLITDSDSSDFLLTSEDDTVTPLANRGDFLNDSNTDPGSTTPSDMKFIVRLMRRAHLGRNAPATNNATDNADNPWVEVDSMVISGLKGFTLSDSSMAATIQAQLNDLRSYERKQPLHARGGHATHAAGNAAATPNPSWANTLGTTNSNTVAASAGTDGAPGIISVDDDGDLTTDDSSELGWAFSDDRPRFDIWQPHFDRDLASVMELLSVPVVGPNRITRDLANEDGKQTRKGTATTIDRIDDVKFAGIQKFLDPSGPDDTANTDDNRWFRLFEFVEVPTRSHLHLGSPFADPRVPGRINLNTIRNPSVLAALIDDSDAFTMDMSGAADHPTLTANHLGADWWEEFIKSRDAGDSGLASAPRIPGTPGSRPFRSYDYAPPTSTTDAVRDLRENTILRSLPTDISSANPNPRLLFELATGAEHLGTSGINIDPHTRNRILSKIAANTTTRSNTFVVFMSVAYFEATGAGTSTYGSPVQIGDRAFGKSANEADYRGFFVIDRTRAEQAYEPSTGKFDHWKRLVRYRQVIDSID